MTAGAQRVLGAGDRGARASPWPAIVLASVGLALIVRALPGTRGWGLADEGLVIAVFAGAILSCLARALLSSADRRIWLLLAVGLAGWSAQSYYVVNPGAALAFPSLVYLAALVFYCCVVAAIVASAARTGPATSAALWLDGLLGALVAAQLGAMVVLDGAVAGSGTEPQVLYGQLSYAVADLFVLGFVMVLSRFGAWRGVFSHRLFAAAFALLAIGDSLYLRAIAHGDPAASATVTSLWAAGPLLLAAMAWAPTTTPGRAARSDSERMAPPVLAAAVAVIVVIVHVFAGHELDFGVVLALLVLPLATARMMIALVESTRDVGRLEAAGGRERVAREALEASEVLYRHAALHDPLTALANRRLFMERADKALAASDDGHPVSLVIIDVDRLKAINDSLGHAAGDAVLIDTAQRLTASVRPGDAVARLGGDEFAVLMAAGGRDAARVCSRRLLDALSPAHTIDGRVVPASASVGAATCSLRDGGTSELVRRADVAMYEAKAAGGRSSMIYDEDLERSTILRRELATELRHAIIDGQLRVFYQPIRRLVDGRISALEALVRWQHPDRGLLAPGDFVRLAEETGWILPLGRFVLAEAAGQASAWNVLRAPELQLNLHVNLTATELAAHDLVETVQEVLASSGLDPHRLVLEIVEGTAVADPKLATRQLARIRALGVRISLDDFGTGYSSLGYLHTMPVFSNLKLDRSLICGDRKRDVMILETIVAMAHGLAMDVVAEGIETPAQRATVTAIGCEYGQGYLLGRPADATSTERLLASESVARVPETVPVPRSVTAKPRRRTVLVVDDHLPTLELLSAQLRLCDIQPRVALTAEEGDRIAREEHPDLILIDLSMPGIDGPELARTIRGHPETADIPLVACSVTPLAEFEGGDFEGDFDGEIDKPIGRSANQLDDRLASFLPAWTLSARDVPGRSGRLKNP